MKNLGKELSVANLRVYNIREYSKKTNELEQLFESFKSEKYPEAEDFIKNKALEATSNNESVTYLVLDKDESKLLGFFTLALRAIRICESNLKNQNASDKFRSMFEYSKADDAYYLSGYKIEYVAKNDNMKNKITGSDLVDTALTIVKRTSSEIGGMLEYVEIDDDPKLIHFFDNNGFNEINIEFEKENNLKYKKIKIL